VRCATYSAHSSWQCEMRCAGSAAAQPIDACRCSHLPPSPTPMSALRAATAAANSFFGTACQPNRGPLIAACTAIFGRLMARGLVTLGCLSRGFPGEWAATHAVLKGLPASKTRQRGHRSVTPIQPRLDRAVGQPAQVQSGAPRTSHARGDWEKCTGKSPFAFLKGHLLHVATERTRTKHCLLSITSLPLRCSWVLRAG
jgi:hypothetical protein